MATDQAGKLESPPGRPPAEAAVIRNDAEGARLAICDLSTRQLHFVSPLGGEPENPIWSPDGKLLLYREGSRLMTHRPGNGADSSILDNLTAEADTPYAFSPDNRFLAAALPEAALILPTIDLSSRKDAHRVELPPGCKITDMLWADDGHDLSILCFPKPGTKDPDLIQAHVTAWRTVSHPARKVSRLLGWKRDALVVSRSRADGGEEAGTLTATGEFRAQAPTPRDEGSEEDSEFVMLYAQLPDEIVTVAAGEDEGDPASLTLWHPGHHPRPWLVSFPRLTNLSLSRDCRWAMFANQAGYEAEGFPGGDIYLTAFGHDNAREVLKGVPGEFSYSNPVPRP